MWMLRGAGCSLFSGVLGGGVGTQDGCGSLEASSAQLLPGSAACFPHFLNLNFLLFFFSFLRPHLWPMGVPRVGVQLELQAYSTATATATQDLSYICDLRYRFQQRWELNPLSEARDRTHILMDTVSGS